MRFWDSSAVVPLIAGQAPSAAVDAEIQLDSGIVVWWGTETECVSAIARLERVGDIGPDGVAAAMEGLARLAATWREVEPSNGVRRLAARLLRTHPLRAGDALQLAAAVVAADGDPGTLPFVTLDERLVDAARREGFPVVVPG